jgi:DNA-binding response OmpR family regulator
LAGRSKAAMIAPMPPRTRSRWLVLVVEDDPDLLTLITRVLEKEKYQVQTANNGEAGLALAAARPKPNLIISDIMMPDMDGLEMVRRIKDDPNTKPTPVIFLTAKQTPKDVIAGIQAGARHYLTKPFKMQELIEKVRSVIPPHPDDV